MKTEKRVQDLIGQNEKVVLQVYQKMTSLELEF